MERSKLVLVERKRFAAVSAAISTALLFVFLFVSHPFVQALALIGTAVSGWFVTYHGCLAASLALEGHRRVLFDTLAGMLIPAVLALYFVVDASPLTLEGVTQRLRSPYVLIPIGLVAYVSWFASSQADSSEPLKKYLIATAILFITCWTGANGIYSELDDYTDDSSWYVDAEAAKEAKRTGSYLGRFALYVVVSYAAMFIRSRRRNSAAPY